MFTNKLAHFLLLLLKEKGYTVMPSLKKKNKRGSIDKSFLKHRSQIINKAMKKGISLKDIFCYDPPVSRTGRFPPILKDYTH